MAYVVFHRSTGSIAHTLECSTLLLRPFDESQQMSMIIEPGVVPCNRCLWSDGSVRARIIVKKIVNGKRCLPARKKAVYVRLPVGRYTKISVTVGGKLYRFLQPAECPRCASNLITRERGRLWSCFACTWIGAITTSSWTLVDTPIRRDQPGSEPIGFAHSGDGRRRVK